MSTINEELLKLYENYFHELKVRSKDFTGNPSNPLLMHVFPEYENSTKKLLIVGKETNGWAGNIKNNAQSNSLIDYYKELNSILEYYKEFELGHGYYGKKKVKHTLNSPFWNFSRSIYRHLNYQDNAKPKGFLWTNISKMDSGKRNKVLSLENRNYYDFALLKEEIKIVNPDVVIFLTGNEYDIQISDYLGYRIETIDFELNIQKVIDPDKSLPEKSYKIYHPRYLYSLKTNRIVLDVLKKLIEI